MTTRLDSGDHLSSKFIQFLCIETWTIMFRNADSSGVPCKKCRPRFEELTQALDTSHETASRVIKEHKQAFEDLKKELADERYGPFRKGATGTTPGCHDSPLRRGSFTDFFPSYYGRTWQRLSRTRRVLLDTVL